MIRTAFLVEDEGDQVEEVSRVLKKNDFSVSVAADYNSALAQLENIAIELDLIILDRRIPQYAGADVLNAWGDSLLENALRLRPNSKIIVFTGYAEVDQTIRTLSNRGVTRYGQREISKVSLFEKEDAPSFEDEVELFSSVLRSLDDIEVVHASQEGFDSIVDVCTRRVALNINAYSVQVDVLTGGHSDSVVWRGHFVGAEGAIASVVMKLSPSSAAIYGGIAAQIGVDRVAAVTERYSDIRHGFEVCVMQNVNESAESLGKLLREGRLPSSNTVTDLLDELSSTPSITGVKTLEEVVRPLLAWNRVVELAARWGIDVPVPTRHITVEWASRHADLHVENILVQNGHAVIIDFDATCYASAMLDSLTLLLSTLAHSSNGDYAHLWPSADELASSFGSHELTFSASVQPLYEWVLGYKENGHATDREFWGLAFGYSMRQLKYADIIANDDVRPRVIALAKRASLELR